MKIFNENISLNFFYEKLKRIDTHLMHLKERVTE